MAKLINLGMMPSASIEFIDDYLNKTCRILMRDHKVNMQSAPEFNLDTCNFVYSLSVQNNDAHLILDLQQALNAHEIPNSAQLQLGLIRTFKCKIDVVIQSVRSDLKIACLIFCWAKRMTILSRVTTTCMLRA